MLQANETGQDVTMDSAVRSTICSFRSHPGAINETLIIIFYDLNQTVQIVTPK